jgi:GlcNAc-P-P-Und epimerase
MISYYIFGGSGFIGSHLANLLSSKGVPEANIHILDIKAPRFSNIGVYTYCDVREPIQLNSVSSDSIVFNLAAVHTTPGHPDHEYFEANIKGAENITAFAAKHGITKIGFTSSIAPYGASESLKTEDTLPTPNTPYGISKLVAEHIHKTWQVADKEHRTLFIVRPGVVFGNNEGGNFTRLYAAMAKGFFFYPGRKDTIKGSVYVKDVARILYEGTSNLSSSYETYNLTYFPAPSIEKICETIAQHTNVKAPRILIPAWMLKMAAAILYNIAAVLGKKIQGIHPDRVKKLMISTNIVGEKLHNSKYKLQYSLDDAIKDWWKDCNQNGLF